MLLGKNKEFMHALEVARRASDHYSLYEEQQELLWIHARPWLWTRATQGATDSTIVELGVCNGKTMLILAALARFPATYLDLAPEDRFSPAHYYGIDIWGLESSKAECQQMLDRAGLTEYATLYSEDTRKAMDLVPFPIDLLLIDAGHDEENIKADCENWIPKVREGGIVAFHDFDPVDDPERKSAHWAVRYYANLATGDESKWETLGFLQGLMIRRRRVGA
jgi:predicted O-methyltransferase YrrM